jgi:integral membrane protein
MINELIKSPLGQFRIIAFLEGCSYLLFGLTMPLKYYYGLPQPNYIVGALHGTLFILYMVLLLRVSIVNKWKLPKMILAFIASLIPFGTFYADKKLFKENVVEPKN